MGTGRSRRFALVCGLAVAAQGCGSDSGGGNAAAPGAPGNGSASALASADPCALVTKEEVAAAIGEAVVEAKSEGAACSYGTQDAMASSVKVEVARAGGAAQMQAAREAAGALERIGGQMAKGKGAEAQAGEAIAEGGAAPGLGDQAFFGANQQLHVLKGDSYLAVSPPTMRSRMSGGNPFLSDDQKRVMARAIAEKALARL
ncbi:MAG TPA: hypothetical protein VEA61_00030 [Allosphingosinicella sp.]|nr:hypothetical protein [Allosphingosinicella sp.]